MSIAKRVLETLESSDRGDPEAALVTACVAVDATAKREHSAEPKNNVRYKTFLRDYAWLIGLVGLDGVVARQIKLRALHPDLKPAADGSVLLEDVLYTVVRCGLLHEATIAEHVSFNPTAILGYDGSKYQLCRSLPLGLIAAAVASPANRAERVGIPRTIRVGRGTFQLDDLWGKRDELAAQLAQRAI